MNIILGQHYPVESVIHRLDARVKLLAVFVYIATIFIAESFIEYAVAILFTGVIIYMTNVPIKMFFKGLRSLIMIIIFTCILNIFFMPEGNVIWQAGIIKITTGGITMAIKLTIRLVLLITGSSVLTLTTTPIQLTDAIESVLKPFKKIGIPAHEIAMMMTIALRFIPTLIEELDKIKKAQMARGADFESGGLIEKAKSLIPLLVPLFISSFRRADELAMAMEARCYRGDIERTRMKKYLLNKNDYRACIVMTLFLVIMILMRIML